MVRLLQNTSQESVVPELTADLSKNISKSKSIKKIIEDICSQDTKEIVHNEKISLKLPNGRNAVGIPDLVIKDRKSKKNLYMVIKGSDTFPASIADIAMLKSIREQKRKEGEKQHRYMIFCEEESNDHTKKIAHHLMINYINHKHYLKSQLREYFDDV